MKLNNKNIRWQMAGYIGVAVVLALLCECGVLDHPVFLVSPLAEYWLGVVAVLLTVTALPLGLKLPTFPKMREKAEASEAGLQQVATLQLAMIGSALLINTIIYYGFSTGVTCGYLALMCLVGLFFI